MAEPGKKEEEKLGRWQHEIEVARKHRKPYLTNWNYYEKMNDDNLWGSNAGTFEQANRKTTQNTQDFIPQVNVIDPIIMSIIPRIHIFSPVFQIQATFNDYQSRFSALVWESAADVFYEMLEMYDTMEEVIQDTLLLGGGLTKVGYSYQLELPGYTLADSTIDEPIIKNENVFAGYVSPKDMLWDYRIDRWNYKRWLAEEIIKPVQEIKDSGLYKNTSDLSGTINPAQNIEGIKRKERNDGEGEMVMLIEIHNLAESKIITLAEGHNRILREDDDYDMELYSQLSFQHTRPRRFWGKSLAQSVEEHAIALSKVYSYLIGHSKKAGTTKLIVEAASFTPEAMKQLRSNRDIEIVPADGVISGEPVRELKLGGPGPDWYNNLTVIDAFIRQISGVTKQEQGRHETGVRTAFEVSKLLEGSDVRNRHRIKKLDIYTAGVMEKILTIASDNIPVQKIAEMVGLPSEFAFMILPFDKMKLRVKFGSTALEAEQEKLNRVANFAQLAAAMGLQVNPQVFMELMSDALGLEIWEKGLIQNVQQQGGEAGGQQAGRPPAPNLSALQQGGR